MKTRLDLRWLWITQVSKKQWVIRVWKQGEESKLEI